MQDASPIFRYPVRIYWEDTDAGGIVFYANYLKFFERSRTEWLRAIDVGQQELLEQHDAMFVDKSVNADYHAPARLDDTLRLTLSIEKMGRASIVFLQQAWCGDRLLNTARVKIGVMRDTLSIPAIAVGSEGTGAPASTICTGSAPPTFTPSSDGILSVA